MASRLLTMMTATAGLAATLIANGSAYAGPNLLPDGSFVNAITTVNTDYAIPTTCVYNSNAGAGCQYSETTVFVNTNPIYDHPNWASFTTEGSGNAGPNMLIVNGGSVPSDASLAFWKQGSIGVTAYETYQFTGWAASNYLTNPAVLEATFNGVSAGDPFTVSVVGGTQGAPNNGWAEFTFDWFSGSATTLNLALLDLASQSDGNDFSVTNFSLEQTSVPEPASAAALIAGLSAVTIIRLRRRRRG